MQINISIEAKETSDRVFVETFDDGVWLAVHSRGFRAHTILSKDEARELIAALAAVVEAE